MSNHAVLQLDAIGKTYGRGERRVEVLHNVSLSIAEKEVVALVGPSGSGKSTLLHSAGLLDMPDSGRILLAGEDMTAAGDTRRTAARLAHIGFVYQFHHLLPECTALENVMLPQWLAGVSRADAKARATKLLSEMGLEKRIEHLPSELSGGEQQRVAIARALANRPSLLLADEPTGNLDPETANHVFRLLIDIAANEGTAMLLATHNMDIAGHASRVVDVTAL